MTHPEAVEYIRSIGGLIFSWPAVMLIAVVLLRRQIAPAARSLLDFLAQIRKGKFGPVQFENFERLVARSESSISVVENINVEIAKSRVIELEVSLRTSYVRFTEEEREQIILQINSLKSYIQQLEKDGVVVGKASASIADQQEQKEKSRRKRN
jgi:hypothetical protein